MPDSTTPALTEEEWRDLGGVVVPAPQTEYEVYGKVLAMHFGDPSSPSIIARTRGERKHLAALFALLGEPFGFTWEDVDDLRYMGEREISAEKYGEQGANAAYGESLLRIAARIAALLPPRQG